MLPPLYVLVTESVARLPWLEAAEAALAGGAGVLQLREKCLEDHALEARGRALRALCDRYGALLIVNDRPDIAVRVAADGVHVGQQDLSVAAARAEVGPHRLVGISTHTPAQARRAAAEAPDYIAVGPMFPSITKPRPEIAGPALLRAVRGEIDLPLVAIGGITAANAGRLRAADTLAVCAAVLAAADPQRAARELLAARGGGD